LASDLQEILTGLQYIRSTRPRSSSPDTPCAIVNRRRSLNCKHAARPSGTESAQTYGTAFVVITEQPDERVAPQRVTQRAQYVVHLIVTSRTTDRPLGDLDLQILHCAHGARLQTTQSQLYIRYLLYLSRIEYALGYLHAELTGQIRSFLHRCFKYRFCIAVAKVEQLLENPTKKMLSAIYQNPLNCFRTLLRGGEVRRDGPPHENSRIRPWCLLRSS